MKSLCILLLASTLSGIDLESIQKEPNLERRSQLAMEEAGNAFSSAREAYAAGDAARGQTALNEVASAVELAQEALVDSGKDPRRDPKFFKRAELSTRQLLRKLEGLAEAVSFEDRPLAEKIRDRVSEIHDQFLNGLMQKKRK